MRICCFDIHRVEEPAVCLMTHAMAERGSRTLVNGVKGKRKAMLGVLQVRASSTEISADGPYEFVWSERYLYFYTLSSSHIRSRIMTSDSYLKQFQVSVCLSLPRCIRVSANIWKISYTMPKPISRLDIQSSPQRVNEDFFYFIEKECWFQN